MNARIFRAALVLGCLLFAGRPAFAAKQYVYLHDRGNPNQVFAYQLKGTNLLPVAGSPFADSAGAGVTFDGDGDTLAYSDVKKEVFVSGSAGIAALKVNVDGSLTEVPGSPFGPASNYMGVVVVEKTGSTYVYAADFTNGTRLVGFKVNSNGGLDSLPSSPYTTESGCFGVSATGGALFVACMNTSVIDPFKVNDDGSLTGAPDPNFGLPGGLPYNVFADPAGKYVYAPQAIGQSVYGFAINPADASLSPIGGLTFPADITNVGAGLAIGKTLLFAFAYSDDEIQDIQVYARAKKTGALTKLNHISSQFAGVRSGATVGNVLIVATSTGDAIRTYKIQGKGKLTVAHTITPTLGLVTHILTLKR